MQTLLDTFSEEIGSQQDQDFFQDMDVKKNKNQIQATAVPKLKPEIY